MSFLGLPWALKGYPGGLLGSLEDLPGSLGHSWVSSALLGLSVPSWALLELCWGSTELSRGLWDSPGVLLALLCSLGLSWASPGLSCGSLGLSLGWGSPTLSSGYYHTLRLVVLFAPQCPVSFLGISWALQGSPGSLLGSLEDLLGFPGRSWNSPGLSWGSLGLPGLS
jgi:hypothetical protein